MKAQSRHIETNQTGVHDRLRDTVLKHLSKPYQRPIADHTQHVFDELHTQLSAIVRPIILDACCGVGDSSRALAKLYPNHWVVGIDKSASRLSRERADKPLDNLILARADLNDFYRLAVEANWQVDRHYILYPNPWPKAAHLGRRWHGAPVFPIMLQLGGRLELRSNWKLYLEEFQQALELVGHTASLNSFSPTVCLTPFEKKYHESGQALWRLVANVSG